MGWPYKTVLMLGCTAGLGVAMAERMMEHGSFIIAVGRRKDRLDAFAAKHGPDKVATSQFDLSDLDAIKPWVEGIIAQHPALDCVVLNAGIQRKLDFTRPEEIDAALVRKEIDTNYTAHVLLLAAVLPHLRQLGHQRQGEEEGEKKRRAAVVAVSSGLALVPLPRCAGYCASKAALHALAWSLRAQLRADPGSGHIRVVEVVPPAVQTELHLLQPDMVAAGQAHIGITIDDFLRDCWAGLEAGDEEILVGPIKANFAHLEDGKRAVFDKFVGGLAPGKSAT